MPRPWYTGRTSRLRRRPEPDCFEICEMQYQCIGNRCMCFNNDPMFGCVRSTCGYDLAIPWQAGIVEECSIQGAQPISSTSASTSRSSTPTASIRSSNRPQQPPTLSPTIRTSTKTTPQPSGIRQEGDDNQSPLDSPTGTVVSNAPSLAVSTSLPPAISSYVSDSPNESATSSSSSLSSSSDDFLLSASSSSLQTSQNFTTSSYTEAALSSFPSASANSSVISDSAASSSVATVFEDPQDSSADGLKSAHFAGIVIGLVGLLLAVMLGGYYVRRRRRRRASVPARTKESSKAYGGREEKQRATNSWTHFGGAKGSLITMDYNQA